MSSRNNLRARWRGFLGAIGGILLVLATSGCMVTAPKVVKLLPPVDLLQDCGKSETFIAKNKDLAKAYQLRDADLDRCNLDKRALRAWSQDGIDTEPTDDRQALP